MAEGKTIQHNNSGSIESPLWEDQDTILLGDTPERYRIKPEPRKPLEAWLFVTTSNKLTGDGTIEIKKPVNPFFRLFREVIEPEEQ